MKIVLASENQGKIKEIQEILQVPGLKFLSLKDFPGLKPGEEDGENYLENAYKKALPIAQHTQCYALADDSGLEVFALDGRPGLYSARYAGPECQPEENINKILHELAGQESREAKFVCFLALVSPDGELWSASGILKGQISQERKGKHGFGYDPIFFVPEKGKTLAELSALEKNEISHRRKALINLSNILNQEFLSKNQEAR